MGCFNFSLDPGLMKILQKELGLTTFIETGTFKGDTLAMALDEFTELHSVELSDELFAAAAERFSDKPKIHLHKGNSASTLLAIRSILDGPAFYWLDAHWCVSEFTAGEKSQCPLLNELAALNPLDPRDVVLIDDARLFLAPPPTPHEISDWPSFQSILEIFFKMRNDHEMIVFNDVIVVYPRCVKDAVRKYAACHGVDMLELAHKANNPDIWKKNLRDVQCYADELQGRVNSLLNDTNSLLNYTKSLEKKLAHPLVRVATRIVGLTSMQYKHRT